jgi:hypothetical protein
VSKFSDNIWFTRKARIQASERLRWNGLHAQLILIVYSLANVGFSIAALKYPDFLSGDSDIALITMSICILVISMFITNIDFKGRSQSFKDNYIKLQLLYENSTGDESGCVIAYTELLHECENHQPIDDKFFRVSNSSTLDSRKPTFIEYASVGFYVVTRFTIITFLYLAPALLPLVLK